MPWDSVPWFVEGGAHNSANMARKLAYAALAGRQGIIRPTDLEVRALAVPGTKVRVFPGLCGIRNLTPGALNEMYMGSMLTEDEVNIAATSGSGPRSDMICARVENPFPTNEEWDEPADVTVGPYIKTIVLSNVSNTALVPPGGSGNALIPLARIDIPISTATIIQSYITDLRKMSGVLAETQQFIFPCPGQHSMPTSVNVFTLWPNPPMNAKTIDIPDWATKAIIKGTITAVNLPVGNSIGEIRAGINTARTSPIKYDNNNASGGADRGNLMFGGSVDIPAAWRGTTKPLVTEARSLTAGEGATAPIYAEVYSTVVIEVQFQATPTTNI